MADSVVGMDVRLAVAFYLDGHSDETVKAFCVRAGVTRETFYKYRRRYLEEGLEGLLPRSRRPRSSPTRTGEAVAAAVIAKRHQLAAEGQYAGALSIHYWMLRESGPQPPAPRTIHRILVQHGLVEPEPRKRPKGSYRRFEFSQPNGCWQIDGMKWQLADHTEVVVLRVLDDHSRKSLGSLACGRENTANAWALMQTCMDRHGRPAMFLSDGGTAFTQRRTHTRGLGEFEARLRHHGILPVVSSPSHPQTCGKKEREWQTLQRWLNARPRAQNLNELQRQLDAYDLIYNQQRPHQALKGGTPEERYRATPRAVAADQPLAAPLQTRTATARRNGVIDIGRGQQASIGKQWAYATVTVLREDPAVAVFHGDSLIHFLHVDPDRRYQLKQPQPERG
jgi:transposase InsO family protein